MNQCLLITLTIGSVNGFLEDFIKKQTHALRLEGVAHLISNNNVRIIVCGENSSIDKFIDQLYEKTGKYDLGDISVESFFKERDYRGVFRVVS